MSSQNKAGQGILYSALKNYIQLTAQIPEEFTEDAEILHYNRQRRLLSFLENLVVQFRMDDEDYQEKIEKAEDDFDSYSNYKKLIKYLRKREEALFELLSRKRIFRLSSEQSIDEAIPLNPEEPEK